MAEQNSEDRKIEYEISLEDVAFGEGMFKAASHTQRVAEEMKTASNAARQTAGAVKDTGGAAEAAGLKMGESKSQIEHSDKALQDFIKSAASVSFDFLKDALGVFDESAEATGKLESSLKATGYAAGLTVKDLEGQANLLQQTTLYTDEATMGLQSVLLGFKKIDGNEFEAAVPLIQDMATALGDDLEKAASRVGKALEDPAGGLEELEKSGVSFSNSQKQTIKSLMDQNDVAGAQREILSQLRDQYGGAAEAAAQAGAGPFQVLNNQFVEMKEGVGGLVSFGLSRLKPAFDMAMEPLKFFSGALYEANEWVRENEDAATLLMGAVAALGLAIGGSTLVAEGASFATKVLTGVQWAFNAALEANPVGVVVAGLLALSAGVLYAYENVAWFRGGVLGIWYVLQELANYISTVMTGTLKGLGDMVAGVFSFDTDMISRGFDKATGAFAEGGKRMKDAFNRGMAEGEAIVAANKAEKKELTAEEQMQKYRGNIPPVPVQPQGVPGDDGQPKPKTTAGKNAGAPVAPKSNVDKVSGNNPVTINITIRDGLVKTINLTTNNFKESMGRMKDEVAEALTGAIRDSQIIAGR